MLWLALHFHSLPLEIFSRVQRLPEPLAVVFPQGRDAAIVICNAAARRLGVHPGMPLAAAWALAPMLKALARDETAEQAALERIAAWAIQFTPAVSIDPPAGVLLEIGGSLALFGGLERLGALVARGLGELGYSATAACAPPPLAALLFARAGRAARIESRDALERALAELPITALAQPPEAIETLRAIGATTLGDLLALPRDGLARRCGQGLLDDLDRALGKLPDPRRTFTPPPHFKNRLELPCAVSQVDVLVFAARRLVAELCGFLAATGNGVQRMRLVLAHEDHAPTRIAIGFAAPTRDREHLAVVLRERLSGFPLPCPAIAIALESGQLAPLSSRNLSLLPDAREEAENATRLIERLRARLGHDAVLGITPAADYRPECAWRMGEPGAASAIAAFPPRPLWLLDPPRPLNEVGAVPHHEGAPLMLLAGPERIESGWWDGKDVARDYFVARAQGESLLWIYRERRFSGGWYLHGIFG